MLVLGLALPASAATGTTGEPTDVVVPLPGPGGFIASETQAAIQLRNGMKARQEEITIKIMTTRTDVEALINDIYNKALEHTGVPTEGDYLRWHTGDWDCDVVGTTEGGYNKLTMTYTFEYYTTAQQEAELDEEFAQLDEIDFDALSDYDKVKVIYDAICQNVKYDQEGLDAGNKLIYSAYSAAVLEKAVCQGYANLFYRLALFVGLDARVIAGTCTEGNHAWNIVKVDGKYYNVDSTWDAALFQAEQEYQYFLKANENFGDHTRAAEYATEEFNTAYPMATEDYVPNAIIPGDMDDNGVVNVDDVVRLLLYVTVGGQFSVSYAPDFDGNGRTDVDDVVRLLLFVTVGDRFDIS